MEATKSKESKEVVKRPDRAELTKQVDGIMAEILALNEKAKKAKAEMERIMNDRGGNRGELDAARQAMKILMTERNRLMAERQEITVSRDACREKLNALINSEKAMRHDMKFSSVEAIDSQIRELELRQARTTMSLNDEKKLVKDIHNLQMSKKTVGALSELKAGVEKEKSNRMELDRRITEKNVELKAVNDRTTAQRAVLDALNKETSSEREVIPSLRKEQAEAREQAEAKYHSIKALRAEFKKKEDAWNVFQAELVAKRKEAKQKELEAKAIEEEARRKQLEAEELARIPYEAEMNLCDNLSVYLRGLLPEKEAGAGASSGAAAAAGPSMQGMKLLSRDTEDYAVLGGSKKGKGKKKGGNGKKETVGHSMDTLASFAMLQITPPTTVSQIAGSLEALEAKKESYQGIERGSVPTMAELAEARQGKVSSGSSKPAKKTKDYSLEADFPSLAPNGEAKALPEVEEEGVSA